MKKQNVQRLFVMFAVLFLFGGAVWAQKQERSDAGKPAVTKALAVLHPTAGSNVQGTVIFAKEGNQVKVTADIGGLAPGKHGFHIHEWGDCGAPDGTGAGSHFNPASKPHGAPQDGQRHAGDLGNLEAGADGKARLNVTLSELQLDGASSIIGRAIIIHAQADDLKSQPAGNAGARQACGVIGIAKP